MGISVCCNSKSTQELSKLQSDRLKDSVPKIRSPVNKYFDEIDSIQDIKTVRSTQGISSPLENSNKSLDNIVRN